MERKYECYECNKTFNEEELNENLFCPKCQERLLPAANEKINPLEGKSIVEMAKKYQEISCKKHIFNRGWFDRKDPSEHTGEYLLCFSLYQIYNGC